MAWPQVVSGVGVVNALARTRGLEITRDIRFSNERRGLLDVYAPKEARDAPLALFFYGGSWEEGQKADYKFAAAALAQRGIVTVVPDYRLYPDVRFPDFIADGARAVRWARKNAVEFGADPRLIFLVGHSAGAYIAAMLTLNRTWLDQESLASVAGLVGLAGPYDFLPLRSDNLKRIFAPAGGDLSSSQPVTYARGDAAPMLLVHGLADTTVSPKNTRHLAAAIRLRGGDVETKFYKRVSHTLLIGGFSPPLRPLIPSLAETVAFIRRRAEAVRRGARSSFQPSRFA